MLNNSNKLISKLIFESYVNEAILDSSIKEKFFPEDKYAKKIPNYKVFKLLRLFKKNGLVVIFLLNILVFLIAPIIFIISFFNLIISVFFFIFSCNKDVEELPEEILFPVNNNYKLFNYLYKDFDSKVHFKCKYEIRHLKYLTPKDYISSLLITISVLFKTISNSDKKYGKDLMLHIIDIIPLTWFSLFIYKLNVAEKSFVTDSNIQRWSYLLTHLSKRCSVIQHAYIYNDIDFKYLFGNVKFLYVFDKIFIKDFSCYYSIDNTDTIKPTLLLENFPTNKKVLFLASSSPFVSFELEFLKYIKKKCDFFILLKKHPSHIYDEASITKLTKLANKVVKNNTYPDCDFMVSYDSFLGFEYKAMGKNVTFLKNKRWEVDFHNCKSISHE